MDFANCPFCGETNDFTVVGDWKGWPLDYVVCGTCHAHGPDGESRDQAVANWNRRPTSTLAYAVNTGAMLDSTGHNHVMRYTPISRPSPASIETTDDLAAARERRELAGLPSVSTEIGDAGLSMDFDLGGDPKKR